MYGQQPGQRPDWRRQSPGHGSPSQPPGQLRQRHGEGPQKESKLVAFREWLSTGTGIASLAVAIVTLVIGLLAASRGHSAPSQKSPPSAALGPSTAAPEPFPSNFSPSSTPPSRSPSPSPSYGLLQALLSKDAVSPTATVDASGTSLSQAESLCGGSSSKAIAAASELITDQQDGTNDQQNGYFVGTYLNETLTSWRNAADASQSITADRQAVDQSGSCTAIDPEGESKTEFTGDYPGAPPPGCVSPGQYFATHINYSIPSNPFSFYGLHIEAQCGTVIVSVELADDTPETITLQSVNRYLSSAISKLDRSFHK